MIFVEKMRLDSLTERFFATKIIFELIFKKILILWRFSAIHTPAFAASSSFDLLPSLLVSFSFPAVKSSTIFFTNPS